MNSIDTAAARPPFSASEATPAATSDRRAYRMSSLDILRGLVIVVMALDHVRDFVMTAAVQDPTAVAATSPLLFATRWITHFCAPTFVFLAGTSAGLMARRKSPSELAAFLLTRGLWLIVLELLVVSLTWTFAPTGVAGFGGRIGIGLQVIWVIGASMVLLAGAQFLGRRACLAIGAAIVLGHNFWTRCGLQRAPPDTPLPYGPSPCATGLRGRPVLDLFSYPLLPWTGVMFLGYGAASRFELPEKQRREWLIRIGVSLTLRSF